MSAVVSIHRGALLALVSRSWASGGDLYHDGRRVDPEDAADLITEWRQQAAVHAVTHQRLADAFERAADDLEAALDEARKWRRCWMGAGSGMDGV